MHLGSVCPVFVISVCTWREKADRVQEKNFLGNGQACVTGKVIGELMVWIYP